MSTREGSWGVQAERYMRHPDPAGTPAFSHPHRHGRGCQHAYPDNAHARGWQLLMLLHATPSEFFSNATVDCQAPHRRNPTIMCGACAVVETGYSTRPAVDCTQWLPLCACPSSPPSRQPTCLGVATHSRLCTCRQCRQTPPRRSRWPGRSFLPFAYGNVPNDVYANLGNITAPALVVAGRQDQVLPISGIMDLVNKIPDSSSLLFPDAGHAAILQHSLTCAAVISAWLDQDAVESGGAMSD